jgi:hypothetical protein
LFHRSIGILADIDAQDAVEPAPANALDEVVDPFAVEPQAVDHGLRGR